MKRVPEDFADLTRTTPGRFAPRAIGGELTEVERLARYAWAAALASDRRVLDVGCGLGDGTSALVEAGAAFVAGVDVGEAIVEVARTRVPANAELRVAQLHELPFEDDAFDLVVCFESLPHVADGAALLDELKRVLAADGLVAASVPVDRRDLEAALASRWRKLRVVAQRDAVATTLIDETTQSSDGARQPTLVRAGADDPPVEAVRRLLLAGDVLLPAAADLVVLGSSFDVRQWLERFRNQQRVLEEQADYLTELQQGLADRADLLQRLAELEAALAARNVLQAELQATDDSRRRLAEDTATLRYRVERADRVMRDIQSSVSWRVTKPLRAVKRFFR
jgi:ubiquinone/menaquinone biosynthesis C-methylase UbiE